jgi:hypothetical protein
LFQQMMHLKLVSRMLTAHDVLLYVPFIEVTSRSSGQRHHRTGRRDLP